MNSRPRTFLWALLTAGTLGCAKSEDPAGSGGGGGSDGRDDSTSGSSASGGSTTGSGSTTTSSSTTTASGGGTDTMGFIETPDVATNPQSCDVLAQDCPDENEKCTPASLDGDGVPEATLCVEIVVDPKSPGDDCAWEGAVFSGMDDCDKGTWCFPASLDDAANNTGMGYCQQLCQGTVAAPTCPEANQVCELANDGALPWCLEHCDPLVVECAEGQSCYPHSDGTFACKLMNPGAYGEPCSLGNQCDPGLVCASASIVPGCTEQSAANCCSEWCDTSLPDPDSQCMGQADGQVCTPAYGDMEPPPGYENVGLCGIPA